ncbi:hypothetical protein FACS189426_06170 [Bacteroidia bacterium]|nr:hypothetical protein FACS189426_06170 [Bacteroidia bacterium]GHV71241.1 hypothetical protein FACS189420_5610 [Bacteroidia bacterium]
MENINEILKLFSENSLEFEKSGLVQQEFNSVAKRLEKFGYATVYREENNNRCEIIVLNRDGIKAKNKLK